MRSRGILLLLFTLLLVLVPFLFWRATWFGRRLDDREIEQCLASDKPRLTQQGLAQVAERIIGGRMTRAAAARWYPRVVLLADHRLPVMRTTAAWVMGQDNSSEEFHRALLRLLHDPEVLVRRNAALSLVRFGDASGRPEILGMLHAYAVTSPAAGLLSFNLNEGDLINPETLLAKLSTAGNGAIEVRSPLPGHVEKMLVSGGQMVAAGDRIMLLAPSSDQIWEALRALVLVGCPEDLPEIERLTAAGTDREDLTDKIHQQAALTARAIRGRL